MNIINFSSVIIDCKATYALLFPNLDILQLFLNSLMRYGLTLYLQNTKVHFTASKQFIDAEGRIEMSFKSTHQTNRKTGKNK